MNAATNEYINQVQRLLRTTEECLTAIPARLVKSDGRKIACIVSIVQSTTLRENGLFVVKSELSTKKIMGHIPTAKLKTTVEYCLPIVKNTSIGVQTFNDATTFGFCFVDGKKESFIFEADSETDQNRILLEVKAAQEIASKESKNERDQTHIWIQHYESKEKKHRNEKVFYTDLSVTTTTTPTTTPHHDIVSVPSSPSQTGISSIIVSSDEEEEVLADGSRRRKAKMPFMRKREMSIAQLLKTREKEYTERVSTTISISTWNVNGKVQEESLKEWLAIDFDADITVIGLQEIVDLNAQNLVRTDNTRAQNWEKLFEKELNGKQPYKLVASRQLVGVYIAVYVKAIHYSYLSELCMNSAGCGLGGWMGNKGGVGIRFKFYNSTICFLNSHLDADKERVEGRNADMNDIAQRMQFKVSAEDETVLNIMNHDFVFWFGDLNYRTSLPFDEVAYHIQNKNWEELIKYDQLTTERQKGNCFVGFQEELVRFAPTYKYIIDTETYDDKRTPSWCDRVLWAGQFVKCEKYDRIELKGSDHRPVSCVFTAEITRTINDRLHEVYQDVVRTLDKEENDSIPDIKVLSNSVNFGDVFYDQPVTLTTVIENVGVTPAEYDFVPQGNATEICKPWLSMSPPFGIILPGKSVTLTLKVHIKGEMSWGFYTTDTVDDVLILRIQKGGDFFIHVSGKYRPSCFGNSLQKLVCMETSVRSYSIPYNDLILTNPLMSIPKELWRMCDFISSSDIDDDSLFEQSGVESEIARIRESLDNNSPFPKNISVHSMAECLIRFLDSLQESVVYQSFYSDILLHYSDSQASKQIVLDLDSVHFNVFLYLICFIRSICERVKKLSVSSIIGVFAEVLLRDGSQRYSRKTSVNNNNNNNSNNNNNNGRDLPLIHKRVCFLTHFFDNE